MFRKDAENTVFSWLYTSFMLLVYLFIPLFVQGCIASITLNKEVSKKDPNNYTITSEAFSIKEPIPFNLSEVSLKFVYMVKGDETKFIFNFYYFGPKREDITEMNIIVDGQNYQYVSAIPVKLEEHGMLGFSEQVYIELPLGTINKIVDSSESKLVLLGNNQDFSKDFDKVMKAKLAAFVKEVTK